MINTCEIFSGRMIFRLESDCRVTAPRGHRFRGAPLPYVPYVISLNSCTTIKTSFEKADGKSVYFANGIKI